MQIDYYSCHTAVVGLTDRTAYLAVRCAPAHCRLAVRGRLAVAGVTCNNGIFIMLVGYCRAVKIVVVQAVIDGVRHHIAAGLFSQQHKLIHCRTIRFPAQQHTGLHCCRGITLCGTESSDGRRFIEIERRAGYLYRFQRCRILHMQVRTRLVDAHCILVMRATLVGDVRVSGNPTAVLLPFDAILRNDKLHRLPRFLYCPLQYQIRRPVPHALAIFINTYRCRHQFDQTVFNCM